MMNCSFVLRNLLMLTVDHSQSVQQIRRCHGRFRNATFHSLLLGHEVESLAFLALLVLVFLGFLVCYRG
jgi:hypothetical protein